MSDEPVSGSDGGDEAAAADVDEANLPALMIGTQYIKDLSFENPRGPEALLGLKEAPRINVEISTAARHLGENVYESTILLRGEATADEQTVFIVELTYACVVTVNTNVPEEHVQPLLLIEAPRHLFPFARHIVATATRDGGFPPLMINPIDFAALYAQQHANA